MQFSSNGFTLQRSSQRRSINCNFKAAKGIPSIEQSPISEFSHDASRFLRLPEPKKVSAAKNSFLGDISNYIALGSITTSSGTTDHWSYDGWTEVSVYTDVINQQYGADLHHLHTLLHSNLFRKEYHLDEDHSHSLHNENIFRDQYDLANLQFYRLLQHGWIRMFIGRHQTQEHSMVARIYVLPDDVGRRFIDRDDKALRKRLMALVEQLDMSCESWDGRKPRDEATEQYRTDLVNEDSLFYLFNMLSSPSPLIPDVSCRYGKDAIESLLKDLVPVPGLKTTLYPYQRRSAAMMIRREVEPARTLDPRFESFKNPVGRVFYYDRLSGVVLREQRVYEEARGGILAEV